MPKFNKPIDELENRFEKWIYVLKNLPKLDRVPEKLREKIFLKLFEKAEIAKFNQEEYMQYEESLKYYRDLKNSLDTAREEGRQDEKLEIAKKLKELGMSPKEIHDITRLSWEDIERL